MMKMIIAKDWIIMNRVICQNILMAAIKSIVFFNLWSRLNHYCTARIASTILFIWVLLFSINEVFSQDDCGIAVMTDDLVTMIPDLPQYMLNDSTGILCGGPGYTLQYSPDFEFTDPDPSTPTGLRLLVFTARPDVDGWVSLDQLRDHPDLLKDVDGEPLVVGTDSSYWVGRISSHEILFGLPPPLRVWLVPVIVHDAESTTNSSYFENENCIYIRANNLFSIIIVDHVSSQPRYLSYNRELEQFIFKMEGGLPEYDPETFDYTFGVLNTLTGDTLELIRHSDRVFGFKPVGLKGIYDLYTGTANGPSCGGAITGLPLSIPQPILFIPDTTSYAGEEVCLPVTVGEFVDIDSFTFTLDWDPEVLDFNTVTAIDWTAFTSGEFSYNYHPGDDFVTITWSGGDGPVTLPDGAVLLELCLDVTGNNGDHSPVLSTGTDNRIYIGAEYLEPRIIEGSVRVVTDNFVDLSYTVISCGQGLRDRVNLLFSIVGKYPPFSVTFDPIVGRDLVLESNRDTLHIIPEGTYTITVTDAMGNVGMKVNQVIEDPSGRVDFSIDEDLTRPPLCHGGDDGQIVLDLDGDPKQVTIGYSRPGGDTILVEDDLIAGLEAGDYQLWAVNHDGCRDTIVRTVNLSEPARLAIEVENVELSCADSGILVHFSEGVSGGTGRTSYSLNGGMFVDISVDSILTDGEYTVVVADENGCTATEDFRVQPVSSDLSFEFDVDGDSLHVKDGEIFELIADVDGPDPDLEYDWQQNGGELLAANRNRARFAFHNDGMVRLTITDGMKCTYSDSIPVDVLTEEEDQEEDKKAVITMANIITPNRDGQNERMTLWPVESIRSVDQMSVYDRYGNVIWSRQNLDPHRLYETGWNGLSDRGEVVLPGIYLVVVDIVMDDGEMIQVYGDVLVIR